MDGKQAVTIESPLLPHSFSDGQLDPGRENQPCTLFNCAHDF